MCGGGGDLKTRVGHVATVIGGASLCLCLGPPLPSPFRAPPSAAIAPSTGVPSPSPAVGLGRSSAAGGRRPPRRPLFNGGGGVQEVPGAVTMAVAGDSQTGWGQLLAVGGAVAGGWGASKGMRQGVVGPLGNPPLPLSKGLPPPPPPPFGDIR